MFTVDKYLGKSYDQQKYNCWHFVCEIWEDLTGRKLNSHLPYEWVAKLLWQQAESQAEKLEQLQAPVSPCLVLFQRARAVPHIGVYYNGSVLHLTERGASFMPLHTVSAGFPEVRFYR